jgi:hypothetical protein
MVPKNDNLENVNDYRPISLLNSSIKLITKCLVDRLQQTIMMLIHENQYSFTKSKTIQDCLVWIFEYLHLCHKSKGVLVRGSGPTVPHIQRKSIASDSTERPVARQPDRAPNQHKSGSQVGFLHAPGPGTRTQRTNSAWGGGYHH